MKLDPLIIRFTKEAKTKLRKAVKLKGKEVGRHISMNEFVIHAVLEECNKLSGRLKMKPKEDQSA